MSASKIANHVHTEADTAVTAHALDAQTIDTLLSRYLTVRRASVTICAPLAIEDFVVQPSAEVSPPKWHLAHSSWFFETVLLRKFKPDYQVFNSHYAALFNSYYKALGAHTQQSMRGHLSRPSVSEVMQYRAYVDAHMVEFIAQHTLTAAFVALLEIGLHHEQQHQELLYMDILTILSRNSVPVQYTQAALPPSPASVNTWSTFAEGLYDIGYEGEAFSYDNERPRHKHYQYGFAIRDSVVTNGDYLAFMAAGGYRQAQYWLSQGWDWVSQQALQCPLYWRQLDGAWYEYTLHGLLPLDLHRPLTHISYFEADAYANWQQCRLPTEHELEIFLAAAPMPSAPVANVYHPYNANAASGQVWCWTRSQYAAYPRYQAFDGLLNEYNAKFMCNQFVLRGGCVVTPPDHYRPSYRNFYLAQQQWMFSGIRLAKDTT